MTMEQAIAAVEQVTGSEAASSSQATTLAQPPIYPAGLTVREVEVLRLVAMGLTDAQVAERLVISRRTVNSHLYSIYSKLDVTTRTAAARYAIENKLI
jgi:DNA-binding NarL/FixJ family response regulator